MSPFGKMCSAPALLAALESVRDDLLAGEYFIQEPDDQLGIHILDTIRAAIRQAKGDQS